MFIRHLTLNSARFRKSAVQDSLVSDDAHLKLGAPRSRLLDPSTPFLRFLTSSLPMSSRYYHFLHYYPGSTLRPLPSPPGCWQAIIQAPRGVYYCLRPGLLARFTRCNGEYRRTTVQFSQQLSQGQQQMRSFLKYIFSLLYGLFHSQILQYVLGWW